ncbi:aminoglycoside phosphotransferase family protein (plasmid) [Aliiroseovarius crassostreae]|uniref:Aminoglycoside phosphotransferase family protein n=1 Tax=Aliiroseovarius crassostreae TaxID=154981 RepID=A0A9Q9HF91_9RHOB|nr:aminoglycoside phosphotransferase family protein [Aliiroseovarius crassostreae]UWP97034.1 aminoglycoside phosphotransferase family protein [Aliiroseovarius crassostreae]
MEPVARNIMQKLLDQKLITNRDIVNGSIAILMGRQRNRFFAFKQLNGPSFFMKQAHEAEPGTQESLALEAGIYQAVSDHPAFGNLRKLMPRLLHFDPDSSTLTLELIRDASDIGSASRNASHIDPELVRQAGVIAARFHSVPLADIEDLNLNFDRKPHWIFRLEEDPSPLPSLRGRSKASAELIDLIRSQPDLKTCLSDGCQDSSSEVLIHGDFKWENFLITDHTATEKLKLIDWERANIGDPAWDVGCGIAAFLIHQIMRPDAPENPEQILGAPENVSSMQAYWSGYMSTRPFTMDPLADFRAHCLNMAAARMLVAAYEYCFAQDELPAQSRAFVNMAQYLIAAEGQAQAVRALSGTERAAA